MDKVESRKEEIDSNIETKDGKLGRKKSYADIVIHGNKKWKDLRTESSRVHPIQSDDIRPNLYSSNDNENAWSYCKPSDM